MVVRDRRALRLGLVEVRAEMPQVIRYVVACDSDSTEYVNGEILLVDDVDGVEVSGRRRRILDDAAAVLLVYTDLAEAVAVARSLTAEGPRVMEDTRGPGEEGTVMAGSQPSAESGMVQQR